MAKPSDRSPERKLQVVLSVLRGELSATEAARRVGVAEQTVHNWKRAFLEAGREGLEVLRASRAQSQPYKQREEPVEDATHEAPGWSA